MKHTHKALLIAGSGLLALSAQAQGLYGEVGYSMLNYDESSPGINSQIEPTAVRGIIGYELNPNLAVETHLSLGLSDDTARVAGVSVKGEVENSVGLFVKPKVRLGESVELFGRAGVTSTKVSASAGPFSASDRGTGFAYGAGASFNLTQNLSLNADYMNTYDRKGVKVDGVTFGVGFRF